MSLLVRANHPWISQNLSPNLCARMKSSSCAGARTRTQQASTPSVLLRAAASPLPALETLRRMEQVLAEGRPGIGLGGSATGPFRTLRPYGARARRPFRTLNLRFSEFTEFAEFTEAGPQPIFIFPLFSWTWKRQEFCFLFTRRNRRIEPKADQ
jgi:hypothetical protein